MGENMTKLWAIVRREYLIRVRTKWFVISTLFGPVIFSLFAFVPIIMMKRDASSVAPRVVLIDETGTNLGKYVARAMSANSSTDTDLGGAADVHVATPATLRELEADATRDVTHRLASGYVVLDSATLLGDTVRYAGRRTDSRGERARITNAVRSGLLALRLEAQGVAQGTVDSALSVGTPVLRTAEIGDAGRNTTSPAKAVLAMFVAFLLYVSIIMYGQSMLSGVIEEKLSRVAEIVISSVSPDTLLAGKVLAVTAVGITQQIVWIAGSLLLVGGRAAIFGAPAVARAAQAAPGNGMASSDFLAAVIATPWSWVIAVILFFLLGFVFYGSLYAAVGATVGSEQEARQASQPVIMLLVLTAVFISPTVASPSSDVSLVMSLLPFSSPIIMPLRMAVTDVPVVQIVGSLAILLAACFGAVWVAARIYRVGLLMYGKRPSFRELRRWIAAS